MMLKKLRKFFFSGLSREEISKFSILALAFALITFVFRINAALKNILIKATVGVACIPVAKHISLIVILSFLLIHALLLRRFAKPKLFWIITSFYAFMFFVIAYCFGYTQIFSNKWCAYTVYGFLESYAPLLIVFFWTFVVTRVNVSLAKRSFAFIFACGQLGGFVGATLVAGVSKIGIPILFGINGLLLIMVPVLISKFEHLHKTCRVSDQATKKITTKKRVLDGIRMLFTKPYLFGIFVMIAIYAVIMAVFDYQMQILADKCYSDSAYAIFNAFYGQLVAIVTFIFAFVGANFFIKKFGLRLCLILPPFIVAGLIFFFYLFPSLWVSFACLVTIKSLSYGFNNPVKEIIYIPMCNSVKSSAKGWVETLGESSSRVGGKTVYNLFGVTQNGFMTYGMVLLLGIVGIWLIVALLMGGAFSRLIREDRIIE